MNPGKLNRRVVIQARTTTKDDSGSVVSTWAAHATVWAEVVVQRGREAIIADSDRSQDSRQFRIRYRSITSTGYRLLYQLRFYDITGITEEGIKTTLLLDTVATQSLA